MLVGVPKERNLSVSGSEQVIDAQPSRLTVVDGDGGKRIFCLHAIEKNDRNVVSAKFRQNRLKVEGWNKNQAVDSPGNEIVNLPTRPFFVFACR